MEVPPQPAKGPVTETTMAIFILIIVYLLVLLSIAVWSLRRLFSSAKNYMKIIGLVIIAIYVAVLANETIPWLRDEYGKSFTMGWFGVIHFLVITLTPFTLICWILQFLDRKLN